MGETHRKVEAAQAKRTGAAQQYLAGRETEQADARRVYNERVLALEEGYLGTEAQASGTLGGVDAAVLPYTSRYEFDPAAAGLQISGWNGKTLGDKVDLAGKTTFANDLMQQAEDAARAGDFARAEELRAQASTSLTDIDPKLIPALRDLDLSTVWQLVEDPEMAARSRLSSPLAQGIGQQVREANEFQDWDSEASKRQRQLMSEGGERSIAAQQRDSLRTSRNARMLGGSAGTSANAVRAFDERTAQGFSQQRAQLHAGVAQAFQDFSRQYLKDTAAFAQAYLQNESGIRETYQASLDKLAMFTAEMYTNFAQMSQQYSMFASTRADNEQGRSDARKLAYMETAMGVLGMATQFAIAKAANVPKPTDNAQSGGQVNSANLDSAFYGGGSIVSF